MTHIIPAELAFRDGVLYSERFQDIYASASGGLAHAHQVFLAGNELPAGFADGTVSTIVETGFGAGLNFLATWQAFRSHAPAGARLDYVSVEKHPFRTADLRAVHALHPPLAALSSELLREYPPLTPGFHLLRLDGGRVNLLLLLGDALAQLSQLDARADAFYLDGFSPARNPDMWGAELARQLARLAAPGATLATWSVAGAVREALAAAGFAVQKQSGLSPKRERLVGRFAGRRESAHGARGRVAVIGAGIAGSQCALALAGYGLEVQLLEAGAKPGSGASANPAGLVRPFLSLERGGRGVFTLSAYCYAARRYRQLHDAAAWRPGGVLQLARDGEHGARLARALDWLALPEDIARGVDAAEGADLCGAKTGGPGVWFPGGGWLSGAAACAAALHSAGEQVRVETGARVARIRPGADGLQLLDADERALGSVAAVILANGVDAAALAPRDLALRAVRGQVSMLPCTGAQARSAVCQEGYVIPGGDGRCLVGATYGEGDTELALRRADHEANLGRARRMLPEAFAASLPAAVDGWVGVRCASRDRRPLIGAIAPGLYACLALGSRGFTWAPLAAELLASEIAGAPRPLPRSVLDTLSPARLWTDQPQ